MSVCIEQKTLEDNHNNFSQSLSITKNSLKRSYEYFSRWYLFKQSKVWVVRTRQRRDLAKLDDRMLADIGYTKAQAWEEFTKPFWK